MTKVFTERVLFEDKVAVGVEVLANGKRHKIFSESEVILSAGSIQSPQILQVSGLSLIHI